MTASKPTLVAAMASRICSTSYSSFVIRRTERYAARGLVRGDDLLGGLDAGLGADLVDDGGDIAVGVPDHAQGDRAGVLGQGVAQLVDMPSDDPELGLDVLQRGPRADPELAVAGVGKELLGVAARPAAGSEDCLVPATVGLTTWVQDEDRVGSRSLPRPVRWAKAGAGGRRSRSRWTGSSVRPRG